MWFISGRVLYCYNGDDFTMYKNDPLNPNSLAGEHLECVYADKKGFIRVVDFWRVLNRLRRTNCLLIKVPPDNYLFRIKAASIDVIWAEKIEFQKMNGL